jgi:hypothetical protein
MKKVLFIIMLFVLGFSLMACYGDEEPEDFYDIFPENTTTSDLEQALLDIETLQNDVNTLNTTIAELEDAISENEKQLNDLQGTTYTQEQVYDLIDLLLKDMIDLKYDDMCDISYNEVTQIFTITQYNQYGDVIDIDIVTVADILEIFLETENNK